MSKLTRAQERAAHAYKRVGALDDDTAVSFDDYKVLVNSLGPNVIRSGLMGAVAFVQRSKSSTAERFGADLATGFANEFGVGKSLSSMSDKLRTLALDDYIMATRECLKIALWLKRATQAVNASRPDKEGDAQ